MAFCSLPTAAWFLAWKLRSTWSSKSSARLAARFAAEDVVQSVCRSFFVRARDGEFTFTQSGSLWPLLAQIALNKLRRRCAHHQAARRTPDVEDGDFDVGAFVDPRPDQA